MTHSKRGYRRIAPSSSAALLFAVLSMTPTTSPGLAQVSPAGDIGVCNQCTLCAFGDGEMCQGSFNGASQCSQRMVGETCICDLYGSQCSSEGGSSVFADGSVGLVGRFLVTVNDAGRAEYGGWLLDGGQLGDMYYMTQSPEGVTYLRRRCDGVVVARRYPKALLQELLSNTRVITL